MTISKKKEGQDKSTVPGPIRAFARFRSEIDRAFAEESICDEISRGRRKHLLNGAAGDAVHSLVIPTIRKEFGIFFTGHELADLVASKIASQLKAGGSVTDPACGAGDLLLACARRMPRRGKFVEIVNEWSKRLGGTDIHHIFVDTAKKRLGLQALKSKADVRIWDDKYKSGFRAFPKVVNGDSLRDMSGISRFDCVVTNPPFGETNSPDDIKWSSGKIQTAALFMHRILESAKIGQHIVAVLPDVLRSGSRYARWRQWVAQQAEIAEVEVIGKFDWKADVDVFVLHLIRQHEDARAWPAVRTGPLRGKVRLSTLFDVSVGAFVPFRNGETGSWRAYVDSSSLPKGKTITPTARRRFDGTCVKGPFVTIRRTSNPGDSNRIIASIVRGPGDVAVENHLIVLKPRDGLLRTCRQLVHALESPEHAKWIDKQIRCRHLTVSTIRNLPIRWG